MCFYFNSFLFRLREGTGKGWGGGGKHICVKTFFFLIENLAYFGDAFIC